MHAFWLVLTHDLLEDRRIDNVIIKTFFNSLFLPHFDVICDLLLNRRMATWNLFVKYLLVKFKYFKQLWTIWL